MVLRLARQDEDRHREEQDIDTKTRQEARQGEDKRRNEQDKKLRLGYCLNGTHQKELHDPYDTSLMSFYKNS